MIRHFIAVAIAIPAFANAASMSYQCVNGTAKPNHSYELLRIDTRDSTIQSVHFESEIGPSLSGSFFGCTAEASKGSGSAQWKTKGKITRAVLTGSGDSGSARPTIVIKDSGDTFHVTFDGNTLYFCGAQNVVPKSIIMDKKSRHCEIEPGEM